MAKLTKTKELRVVEVNGKVKAVMNQTEAATFLGISVDVFQADIKPWIDKYQYKDGSKAATYYKVDDLMTWLEEHRVG